MVKFCCKDMGNNVWIPNRPNLDKNTICYSPRFNEYGLLCSEVSMLLIHYCPWCGRRLPEPLQRDRWYDELENMGYESPWDDPIPEEYKSDAWWNKSVDVAQMRKQNGDFDDNRKTIRVLIPEALDK